MEFIISSVLSFSILHYTSHPKSKLHKKFPVKKLRSIQFFPHLNFSLKKHTIHFHHWILFSPILVVAQSSDKGFLSMGVVKGLLLGGIIQGLMYRDRFKFIFKNQEYPTISDSHYHLDSLLRFWKK